MHPRRPAAVRRVVPLLTEPEKAALFAHLREAAVIAQRAGDDGALLRRQALYLCSYDDGSDTHAWLAAMRANPPRRASHSAPAWADMRSVATSLTRYGDRDALHAFITACAQDDRSEAANLNYWAYWLGIDALPQSDDSFMTTRPHGVWDGLSLLRRLADRLDPDLGCVDLNIHSVWALIALRKGLLHADAELNTDLAKRIEHLLGGDTVSRQSRRELESVHYVLRASAR